MQDNKNTNMEYIDMSLIDENNINSDIYSMKNIEHLASIIKENGFNSPITVFKKRDGRYEIISGHRRFRAMLLLKEEKIPAFKVDAINDLEKKKQLISSNITSRQLSPYEMAKQIELYEDILKESGFKGEKRKEIARFFNMTESNVHRYKCLLKLIPELQELTKTPSFPYSSLRAVSSLSEDNQKEVYKTLEVLKHNQLKNNNSKNSEIMNIDINDNVYTRSVIEQIVNNVLKREEDKKKNQSTDDIVESSEEAEDNPKVEESHFAENTVTNNKEIEIFGIDDNDGILILEDNIKPEDSDVRQNFSIDFYAEGEQDIIIETSSADKKKGLIRNIYYTIMSVRDEIEELGEPELNELFNKIVEKLNK